MLIRRAWRVQISWTEEQHFVALPRGHPRKIGTIVAIHERVGAIANKACVGNKNFAQIFAGHALEWIAAENAERSEHLACRGISQLSRLAQPWLRQKASQIRADERGELTRRLRIFQSTGANRADFPRRGKNQYCREGTIQERRTEDQASRKQPPQCH